MYPNRHPGPPPGQPFKFTVSESCDRIKEEFSFLQAQYHSLKMDVEKLAQEKTEMQRHYVMVSVLFVIVVVFLLLSWENLFFLGLILSLFYFLQTEIAKRLNAICAQVIPFLSQEHQQQVAAAVERAKQVTMQELNAIIGQQMQAQHLPHAHAPPIPLTPHPAGLQPPIPPVSSGSSGFLGFQQGAFPIPHGVSSLKGEDKGE
ncbi:transducin-like enhancer protein 4 [Aplysia californica]|uniref:Transducin-like enhancer protein 4 n=1 Tax=Aplysia californica TaxID=6500 RepID=A0ABM1W1Y5_APLCA|nr:transducin-like enhancer protein 4 [Aplysia californica]